MNYHTLPKSMDKGILKFAEDLGFTKNSDRFYYYNTDVCRIQITYFFYKTVHLEKYQICIYEKNGMLRCSYSKDDNSEIFIKQTDIGEVDRVFINKKIDLVRILNKETGLFKELLRKEKWIKLR